MSTRARFSGRSKMNGSVLRFGVLVFVGLISCLGPRTAGAQTTNSQPSGNAAATRPDTEPIMDNQIFIHVLFDQFEGRTNGPDNSLRWDAEGWIGTDMNRLWLKSEAFVDNGNVSDGDQEALYDRPIPRLRYFDAQAGVREDLDSGPHRTWGAVGIQGLAPYFFEFAPTFYFRDGGHVAGRITGSYDLLITQRLIAQPELEMNFYSKRDPQRLTGSGLADIDTGIRLRYEFSRKFAPYVGFAYNGKFGSTATFARQAGEAVSNSSFIFGFRVWY